MTWLLKLYPPRWRRRYERELAELIAPQPFSIGAAIDLVAGAADAWLHPRLVAPAGADAKGDAPMIGRVMRLKCAGYGPAVTRVDEVKSVAVIVGGCLALTMLWFWAERQIGRNEYLVALMPMAYFFPLLLGLRYTSLKGRSAAAQAVFIGGCSAVLVVMFLLAAWVNGKI